MYCCTNNFWYKAFKSIYEYVQQDRYCPYLGNSYLIIYSIYLKLERFHRILRRHRGSFGCRRSRCFRKSKCDRYIISTMDDWNAHVGTALITRDAWDQIKLGVDRPLPPLRDADTLNPEQRVLRYSGKSLWSGTRWFQPASTPIIAPNVQVSRPSGWWTSPFSSPSCGTHNSLSHRQNWSD